MAALTIALLGTPGSGVRALAVALNDALASSGRQPQVQLFENPPLPPDAARFALVLLMGLPPMTAVHALPTGTATRNSDQETENQLQVADLSIRQALADAALAYLVVYGTPAERLAHTLAAIESLLPEAENRSGPHADDALKAGSGSAMTRPWAWLCDKCSDPACEHKLLSDLLVQRAGTA
ncbi:MAG: hypothetical protein JWR60_3655 [Polaromonas sp.]|nr:hypothetical protein [Polaromonas sp.]